MVEANRSRVETPWKFFGLTFALTWLLWIPAGLIHGQEFGTIRTLLHYAGGVMPTLVALSLLFSQKGAEGRRDYWQRLIDFRRIGIGWYAVIFLTVPVLTLLGVLVGRDEAAFDAAKTWIENPTSLIPFALFMLLFGPLPEEMAWRGYALEGLQLRRNALNASLILGFFWTIWHLPLFLIDNSYQQGLGIGTPQFWLYMLDKVPLSVVITWIYNNNRRSTLSAVLLHFMVNFVGELVDLPLRGEIVTIAAWWIMAVVVVIIWKPMLKFSKKGP